jgi:hypothetical protein
LPGKTNPSSLDRSHKNEPKPTPTHFDKTKPTLPAIDLLPCQNEANPAFSHSDD